MDEKVNQRKAYLFALLAVLFWSTISSAFKISLRYLSYFELLFWSLLIGGLVLLSILIFTGKQDFYKRLTRKDIIRSAVMGFLNPFLYYLILLKAYNLLEAQVAGTLNYIWPVLLVLLSIPLLKQKIKTYGIVAILISFMGIILISTGGNPFQMHIKNGLGVSLAVGSGFFWALYWIINMKDTRDATEKIFLNTLFGLLYLFVFLLVKNISVKVPSLAGFIGAVYIGFFELSLTFVIWLKALNYSKDTAKVSNLIYLSPFVGLFWVKHAVGEQIHWFTIVGLLFIVGGILLQSFYEKP